MGCGCGKSFSNANRYATGSRTRGASASHVPTSRPPATTVNIQSKSLQARAAQPQNSPGRRKV